MSDTTLVGFTVYDWAVPLVIAEIKEATGYELAAIEGNES